MLAGLGFEALATSSAAAALSIGRRDGELRRDQALEHARLIVGATDLPVSADLERGFGDAPRLWRRRSGWQPGRGWWLHDRGYDRESGSSSLRIRPGG